MTALAEPWMSPDEYLAGELHSETRHEYVSGRVYAMAGASEEHNVISLNIAAAFREHLRGHRCRAFMNDMKVLPRPQQRDLGPQALQPAGVASGRRGVHGDGWEA